jgi:hypothetical protein
LVPPVSVSLDGFSPAFKGRLDDAPELLELELPELDELELLEPHAASRTVARAATTKVAIAHARFLITLPPIGI